MRLSTQNHLTHRERLTRGLAHTAGGPVDVARGAVGLSGAAVQRGAVELRRRYRESRLADHVADAADAAARELVAAGEVVAGLPEVLAYGEPRRHRIRRSWVIAGVAGAALLAGGVVVLIRRSDRPEESSPRPPSVDTQHKI
ncbi:cell wall synthesis protein CwsA [Mycolicibacter sinensis]|uniref:Cell wall synthesis protein CwsA n=1 Tax=Mycolicibacter sinensis (strain JDM601) TaxID=875328 RepID=A0A1A3U4G5_MYCSD|nr:cell wall synthesis protein CwsA [Mycolicibacter sinensis]MDD7812200.1 cell wall synthesis protein CwsA [Mycobacterium sp. CSUR Q5927]OBK89779.1 cell wall synthesis protein CwsA [Mycolicibacter sinensis]